MNQPILFRELIVDNFAGGGGASQGIYEATGIHVDIAINHDQAAIGMHEMNHPATKHYCESVWDINPKEIIKGRPISLAWFSPDCKHFSKAKGSKPVSKNIRGLAWVALRWAATVKPRVIMLENVEEFKTWGPVLENGMPCPDRKGKTFDSFIRALERQGYKVEFKELRACDYGTPTIRKRLFMIARRDGNKIVWPKPTHGDPKSKEVKSGKLMPWPTAADCIDWSIPCKSIFNRKRPLAENTMRRIAKGIKRYVIDADEPFIVKGHAPFIMKYYGGVTGSQATEPLPTVTTVDHNALVVAFLTQYYTETEGSEFRGQSLESPLCTVTTANRYGLVTSHMIKLRGTNIGHGTDEPIHTISAGGNHIGEVRAFLVKYYGSEKDGCSLNEPLHTITTKDKFGLVMVKGCLYRITDIAMRMLQPRELFLAQGFPTDYIIDVDKYGKQITKKDQVARCGNSVCPPLARNLVQANLPELALHNASYAGTDYQSKLAAGAE
ncbi:DNA cytosine methyltransferase [Glaciecola siphonariae]|uniref:DNA (cytosine-5-)-methyltransferase n=1 Tax=Glaciecola siphonariae TaxID=521012 RepID=A0ABV9LV80_9ALTE